MANALFTPKVIPHSCISRNHKRAHIKETQPYAPLASKPPDVEQESSKKPALMPFLPNVGLTVLAGR